MRVTSKSQEGFPLCDGVPPYSVLACTVLCMEKVGTEQKVITLGKEGGAEQQGLIPVTGGYERLGGMAREGTIEGGGEGGALMFWNER